MGVGWGIGLATQRLFRTGWSIVREGVASVLTYELYPLSAATGTMPVLTLPSFVETESRPEVPILFIHGFMHNPSTFAWLKQKLALYGFRNFADINLPTVTRPVPELAIQAAQAVEQVKKRYGVPAIDILAHSLGGLVARYYIQKLGGDSHIRNLITLGTPHQGTEVSKYFWFETVRHLRPDSALIQDLKSCPLPKHTQAVAISGSLDVLLWPRDSARWEGVRNIHLPGVGHAGLLFSRRVLDITLAHLHPQLLRASH